MAAEPNTGMDRANMKKLLMLSKKEPVNCSAALAKEAGVALLLMDKIKPGRALEAMLKKDFPDGKITAFGSVLVDPDEDATLAKFTLNKAGGGLARRLVKTLKGTGIKKVIINDEEGNLLDSHVSEDEEEAAQPAAAAPAPSEPAPPAAPEQAKPDPAQITRDLGRLAAGIAAAAAGNPERQASLVTLAKQVQAALKSNDPAAAATALTALEQAMQAAPTAPAPAPAPATANDPAAAKLAKARQAWIATHQMMLGDLEKLRGAILKNYESDEAVQELDTNFTAAIQPITTSLGLELAEKLETAANAASPDERSTAAAEAHAVIEDYQAFVSDEAIMAELDDNPFLPLSLSVKLSATLTALAGAVR